MEELSRAEFARLNAAEKDAYLNVILGDDDNESNVAFDSEDDDWLPDEVLPESATSDSDKPADNCNIHCNIHLTTQNFHQSLPNNLPSK